MAKRVIGRATARVALSLLFALANLVFVAFAVIGWATSRLDQVVDLVLLGGSCVVGVLVSLALAAANRSAIRGVARIATGVAVLRIPAFALAIYLVAANTTPQPDGSWHLLPGAPLLATGFL